MKKQILLVSLGLALCACRSNKDKDEDYAWEREDTTTPQAREASAPGAFGRLDAYTAEDRDFLVRAAQGGLVEVESSRIALTRAGSSHVRDFANKMIADHGRISDELAQHVQKRNGMLPSKVDAERQGELDRLQRLDGAEFDRAYIDFQKRAHDDAIRLFEKAAREADDADVREFASRTLPMLRHHREMLDEKAKA